MVSMLFVLFMSGGVAADSEFTSNVRDLRAWVLNGNTMSGKAGGESGKHALLWLLTAALWPRRTFPRPAVKLVLIVTVPEATFSTPFTRH
ncbi:uncharacterized protein EI90DRAFT_1321307 [Cantharellus anzutake]|uniref:uncharacterized protein n=1 Tax=Cantharellus anzutake TaxID=1750568 RepID=UPI001906D0ED|nr:uncharacterized protein EI90DRAFT_1321307 [Cantharellus anzutake]KAF8342248.1 hypothetical protein EI90DRAFT_1321307 [Cantharellus anzutake]